MTRAGQRPAVSRGAKWSGGMTLFGDRNPTIVVLRRKERTFADAGGACRAVIGCALAGGAGDCDRPRQDQLPGAQARFLAVLRLIIHLARWAITLRSMTRIGSAGFSRVMTMRLKSIRRTTRNERGVKGRSSD